MTSTGEVTMGHIAMFKAYVTERGRYIAKLGREAFGGNGITHDRYVMKGLMDM